MAGVNVDLGLIKLKFFCCCLKHLAIQCSYQDRASTIGSVLQVYSGKHGRAMIFCHTKKDADELACSTEIKQESHVMHGDIPQGILTEKSFYMNVRRFSIISCFSTFRQA